MTNGWLSIESAPHDGTHILFYYQNGVYTAWYEFIEDEHWHVDSPCDNCWYDIYDENPVNCYWQPIIYPTKL